MKKNKSYIFIILLIAVLIFSVATLCEDCAPDTSDATVDTVKPGTLPINGVIPTKVTATDKSKDMRILDFWNVGEAGSWKYSDAEFHKNGEKYVGKFTGGPNGKFFLYSNRDENKKLNGKLVDGKQFISDDGDVVDIDNPQAFDGWTEDKAEEVAADSIEVEETSTETDTNLHGLVPTKVTVHTHQATDDKDSYSDHYIEFWNIGELGGEQYAKATDHYVATRDGAQFSEITFEGTFTGGPNGLIEMSAVSSSGNDAGSTAKMVLKLIDGKQLENPSNGYISQIVNPEALVGAFDGWKD
jgi:hypothetical protein